MIKFSCSCHTVLEVSDDFAGMSLQCPKCKRLVDVPTLSELQSLDQDGAFKIDELKFRDEPDRLADLQRVYGPSRVDESGNDIDLRGQFGMNDAPIPLAEEDVLEVLDEGPVAPKYDPETGELVRAVDLKTEEAKFDPSTIPMAKAVINYASGRDTAQFSGWQIIPALFHYQNLFVMIIILLVHIFLQLMMFPLVIGMWLVLPGFIVIIAAMLGHYANVVEDIGFDGKDELPRPLRDVSLYDDIWRPFCNMCIAGFLCYGPLLFFHRFPPKAAIAYMGTIIVMGTLGFPAVFLTTTSSGTIMNLAPHKILRVISTMGVKYLFALGLWAITGFIYFLGIAGSLLALANLFTATTGTVAGVTLPVVISYGLLLIGIVMMHGFCWYLGLQYRAHHDEFDWYFQKHQRKIEMIKSPTGIMVPAPTKPVAPLKPPPIPPKAKVAPTPVQPHPPTRYPQSHA